MNLFEAALILFIGSLFAGGLGALSGLGGGLIVVPLLVLGMNVDIHYAIGASLVAVIATSSSSSSEYVKSGYTNMRAGLFLETATTLGVVIGVAIGSRMSAPALFLLFGCILLYCALYSIISNGKVNNPMPPSTLSAYLKLDGHLPPPYYVQNAPLGWFLMLIAGSLSGILGIGSGPFKVLAMDKVMKFPFKISTATSNFMIGVTAATGAGIYLGLGYIDPFLTMPIVVGILLGALTGARLLPYIHTRFLRTLFALLVFVISFQMLYKGIIGVM